MVKMIRTFNPLSVLTSSNIDVDSTPIYDSSTIYIVEDKVKWNNRIWISTANDNQGNEPIIGSTYWFDDSPTNEVAVFDDYPSTISKNISKDLILEFDVNFLKLIAFSEIYGTELKIELINKFNDEVIYTNTIPLIKYQEPQNAYEMKYFWDVPRQMTEHFEEIAQPEFNQKLRVTITQKNGVSSLGFIDFGGEFVVGCRHYDSVKKSTSATSDFVSFADKIKPEIFPKVRAMNISMTIFDNIEAVEEEMEKRIGMRNVIIAPATGNILSHMTIGYFQNFDRDESGFSTNYTASLEIKKIENTI